MKTLTRLAVVGLLCSLAAACVQTTTGRVRSEPAPPEEAAEQYYQLGARYLRNGSYELARDRLKRALELDPRMAIAHSTLALTYLRLGNMKLAENHYELAVRYEPSSVDARNAYAVFLCQRGRYDDAHEQFQRARRIDDITRPEIMLTNAGVCMSQKPDLELAEEYFREALENRSTYGEALLQMSLLKVRQEDYLTARAFLQRFLASNMPTPEVLLLAVEVERAIGDDRAADEYRNRLLREFPESEQARRVIEGR